MTLAETPGAAGPAGAAETPGAGGALGEPETRGDVEIQTVTPAVTAPGSDTEQLASRSWMLTEVTGVSVDLPSQYPEIVLRESAAPFRELRIPIGLAEGTAIAFALRRIETPRPLTHELFTTIMAVQQVSIEGVRITEREGQSFRAELETAGPRGRQVVQCRPSDAIALALRQPMPTPILVAEDIFTEGAGDEGATA